MKASELRCGNIATINNPKYHPEVTGCECVVIGIEEKEHKFFPDSKHSVKVRQGLNTYSQFEEFIDPIPLTEEWLLRFGFESGRFNHLIKNTGNCSSINKKYSDKSLLTLDVDGNCVPLENIKHVHQLQNLYFAITGEELTLKQEWYGNKTHGIFCVS